MVEVGRELFGRPPPASDGGRNLLGVGPGLRHELVHHCEVAEGVLVGVVALGPAARRRQRDDRARPPARGEPQRQVAAERVADEVRGLKARTVHRRLQEIGDRVLIDVSVQRRTAGVAGEGDRQDVVPGLKGREDELPAAPGVGEPVQADHR